MATIPPKKCIPYPRKSVHRTPEKVYTVPPKKCIPKHLKKSGINPTGARVYADGQKTFRLYRLFKPDRGIRRLPVGRRLPPEKRIKKKHRGV